MKEIKLLKMTDNVFSDFYNMKQIDNDWLEIHYGIYGNDGRKQKYPLKDWNKLLNSRLVRGYNDVTSNDNIIKGGSNSIIHNLKPSIKDLIEKLNHHSDDAFKINYTVNITDISELLVNETQELLTDIKNNIKIGTKASELNSKLLRLYKKIPRRIKNLKESLFPNDINTNNDVDKALDKIDVEQALLNIIKKQMNINDTNNSGNLLDHLGLHIDEITENEKNTLIDMLNESKHRFVNAYKVSCFETEKNFQSHLKIAKNKQTKLLFHGSKSENWLGILKHGLKINSGQQTNGKLFNNGIYFADIADKSLGYINGGRWSSNVSNNINSRWIAVFDVHIGNYADYNILKSHYPNNDRYYLSRIDLAEFCNNNGYDSYFANKNIEKRYNLMRDEYIIYNESKCTIKYLIEVK